MTRTSDDVLTVAERRNLSALVVEHGQAGAAGLLGVSRSTVAQALAGLPVLAVTLKLLRTRLGGEA